MAEGGEKAAGREIPRHIGAVFKDSIVAPSMRDPYTEEYVVPDLNILDERDRTVWGFENIRVFSDGTFSAPEARWKQVVDEWLTDMRTAKSRLETKGLITDKKKEDINHLEQDIKAMMAVSASARAMEMSDGSAGAYVGLISQSDPREPNLNVQDLWDGYLLHNHPERLARVINMDLVKPFYIRLLKDAGLEIPPGWKESNWGIKNEKGENIEKPTGEEIYKEINKVQIDSSKESDPDKRETEIGRAKEKARTGKLVEYLRTKNKDWEEKENKKWEYKGGFNAYIAEVLMGEGGQDFILEQFGNNIDTPTIWAAAKLACDAFLVDKFTEWEYEITNGRDTKVNYDLELNPFEGWGGNPLRYLLEPAFLPRRIKKMYRDSAILEEVDRAFLPKDDIFKDKLQGEELQPSMVVHFKEFGRFSQAHWIFLGGSRANGIPVWTEKTMNEDLPKIVELLDQVYGEVKSVKMPKMPKEKKFSTQDEYEKAKEIYDREKDEYDKDRTGKQIVGAMVARILYAKTLALISESAEPRFREKMSYILSDEERPFDAIRKFLWGPSGEAREGFVASLSAERTELVMDASNPFDPLRELDYTKSLLITGNQNWRGWGQAYFMQAMKALLAGARAYAKGR